jgi:hypothetical protein
MNYKRHYELLINKAKKRGKPDCYFEKHHVLPKSLGGTDEKENIVNLTGREHYIAHWMLFRIYKCKKTAAALHSMNQGNKHQKNRFIRSSRAYQESREFLSKYFSGDNNPSKRKEVREKISKKVSGKLNGMYGKVGELNPAYGMKHSKEFLRRKQIIHSNKVFVKDYNNNSCLMFQCVSDCAEFFKCTSENILFRIKQNKKGKFGMFKNIQITY